MRHLLRFLHTTKHVHDLVLYGACSWLLLSGLLQFGIDVVSQFIRGKRAPGPATTLYHGLNSSYAASQILFAALALFAIGQGVTAMGQASGLVLGFLAACVWLALCWVFLEYSQPGLTVLFLQRSLSVLRSQPDIPHPDKLLIPKGSRRLHETRRKNDSDHRWHQRHRI